MTAKLTSDYEALASFVRFEMERQSLQPKDIKNRGGPSWPTLDSILKAAPEERSPATLRKLSESLGYPADTALRVLRGETVEGPSSPRNQEMAELREMIRDIQVRLSELVEQIAERESPSRGGGRRAAGGSR